MGLVLPTIILGALVTGFCLQTAAFNNRTEAAPLLPSADPKHWKLPWKMRPWFTSKGWRLLLLSYLAFVFVAISAILQWIVLPSTPLGKG